MITMEIKPSHKKIREIYAISRNLKIPYSEVKVMSDDERDYLFNCVKNALETGRKPEQTTSAFYKTSKGKLFITEIDKGKDVVFNESLKLSNVLKNVEVEIVFNSLDFKHDTNYNPALFINFNETEVVYIKYDKKMEEISKKDTLYLEIFERMYEVEHVKVIDVFELGGEYNMIHIKKYQQHAKS